MSDNRLRGENHPNAKLTDNQVIEIKKLIKQGFSKRLIARNYKISTWNVDYIAKEFIWKHLK